jgi:hypothetical protein
MVADREQPQTVRRYLWTERGTNTMRIAAIQASAEPRW